MFFMGIGGLRDNSKIRQCGRLYFLEICRFIFLRENEEVKHFGKSGLVS